MLFDKVIAYDHLKQKIGIVVNMRTGRNIEENPGAKGLVAFNPPSPDSRPKETQYLEYLMKEYGRACGEIEAIASPINETAPLKSLHPYPNPFLPAMYPGKPIVIQWRKQRNTSWTATFSRQSSPDSSPVPTAAAC